jgi:hypothetical protein
MKVNLPLLLLSQFSILIELLEVSYLDPIDIRFLRIGVVQQAFVFSDSGAAFFHRYVQFHLWNSNVCRIIRIVIIILAPSWSILTLLSCIKSLLNVMLDVFILDVVLNLAAASLLDLECAASKVSSTKRARLPQVIKWLCNALFVMIKINMLAGSSETEGV